jgi:hypothetical protein
LCVGCGKLFYDPADTNGVAGVEGADGGIGADGAIGADGGLPANAWEDVGGSSTGPGLSGTTIDGYNPFVAVNDAGEPAVVWAVQYADNVAEIYGKIFTGDSWEELSPGSASGTGISNTGIGADLPRLIFRGDVPFVAWYEWGANAEVLIRTLGVSGWEDVTPGSGLNGGVSNNAGISRSPYLVANQNELILAWQDTTGGEFDIRVARKVDASFVGIDGSMSGGGISASAGRSEHPHVVLDVEGRPLVAYEDNVSGNYEIYVKRYEASGWTDVGPGPVATSATDSRFPKVALDDGGQILVAWKEELADGTSAIQMAAHDGVTWTEYSEGSLGPRGITGTATIETGLGDLELDADGRPWVAYTASSPVGSSVFVTAFDGVTWSEVGEGSMIGEGVSGGGGNEAAHSPTLARANDGTWYLAWNGIFEGVGQVYLRRYVPR